MYAAQQRADTLGDGGCHSSGTNTHTKSCHKDQIQNHVDNGRKNQVVQRMAAVSQSVKDAHKNVIHDCEQNTPGVVTEIADRLGHNLFGCSHPQQNGGGEDDARHRQYRAGNQAEGHVRMDGLVHGVIILGAKVPGNDYTGTHGYTIEESHQHKDQASRRAHRSQRRISDKLSHNPGVKSVIKLLKNVSQQHRQGKQKHGFPNGAGYQGGSLVIHGTTLSLSKLHFFSVYYAPDCLGCQGQCPTLCIIAYAAFFPVWFRLKSRPSTATRLLPPWQWESLAGFPRQIPGIKSAQALQVQTK